MSLAIRSTSPGRAWLRALERVPTPLLVLAIGAVEYGLAWVGAHGAAGPRIDRSIVILLLAGALEETARWAVGAGALAAHGMAEAERRLFRFFAWCVAIEAAGAIASLWRHPPGGFVACLLAFAVLRLPPSLAHAGWTWLMVQATRAGARDARAAATLWFATALGTHLAWDFTVAALTVWQHTPA